MSEIIPLRVIPGSHRRGVLRDDELLKTVRSDEIEDVLSVLKGGCASNATLLIHFMEGEVGRERRYSY